MNSPKISKRLLCAAEFARNGDFIADVGTDHAYLPIYLCTKGIIKGAVVSDINEGPIERATKNIIDFSCEKKLLPFFVTDFPKLENIRLILSLFSEWAVNLLQI